jgi:hypothetical protein
LSREIVMSFCRLFVLCGVLSVCGQLASAGEDFAIRTQIYSGSGKTPVAENLTIFHAGKIYDFAERGPRSVTVFDTTTRRFVLAHPNRQVQTSLPADELIRFAAAELAKAKLTDNALVRFAAEPKFVESFDAASGRLSLTSPVWDYHVETQRVDDREMLKRYSEFANWFTYLNVLFRPLPPAVRLELNRVLDQHGCLPVRVVAQIKRDERVVVEQQSRHKLVAPAGAAERDRVRQWEAELADYRLVEFPAYRAGLE